MKSAIPSPLLDNAQFWLGECDAATGDLRSAIEALQKVPTLPDGNKVYDAQRRLRVMRQRLASQSQAGP